MSTPGGGLTAGELTAVLSELDSWPADMRVRDIARIADRDDLLLFFEGAERRPALQVAPGGPRARLCTTRRRFAAAQFATSPQVDQMRQRLRGTRLRGSRQTPGERVCLLDFEGEENSTLAVELFGPRGLWCLLDDGGVILVMSRLPNARGRELRPGATYQPPPPRGATGLQDTATVRFDPPLCDAVDAHFTELDRREEAGRAHRRLQTALERARRKAGQRVDGLLRQREQIAAAGELRQTADLLLAYGHGSKRGDTELVVPHPERDGEQLRLPLDPAAPVYQQADALYKRARKLGDSTEVSARRLAEARAAAAELEQLASRLEAATEDQLPALEKAMIEAGALPRPPRQPSRVDRKATGGEVFRRFTSAEGHPILVGRNNKQNDRLSLRVARGNDVWLHVGQGLAGSHVVIRLPRGKTASLETMLDAGTLAVHFGRARGSPRCEVIYTQAKHVRKPKGLPPGAVVPSHTKTLTVRLEDDRLRRLLDTADR